MILLVVGIAFVLLGLFSGGVLVAAPFGLITLEPSLSLWVFFPVFSLLGLALVIVGDKTAHIRSLSLIVSAVLLLLAVASALGLVLAGASMARAPSGTSSLWFVLVVAGILGGVGAASYSRITGSTHASA
jgi:hypothetical protein